MTTLYKNFSSYPKSTRSIVDINMITINFGQKFCNNGNNWSGTNKRATQLSKRLARRFGYLGE